MSVAALHGIRILLGGPIKAYFASGSFDADARVRYERLIEQLRASGATVYSAPESEQFSLVTTTSRGVTQRDFAWCRAADVYVALWPTGSDGYPVNSQGTAIELGWASVLRCPVLMLWDAENAGNYSHLVRGLSTVVVTEYLDHSSPVTDIAVAIAELYARAREKGTTL